MRIDDELGDPKETRVLEIRSDRESIEPPTASALVRQNGCETIRVEPWGRNSVRVRISLGAVNDDGLGALLTPPPTAPAASVQHGGTRLLVDDLAVEVNDHGRMRFSRAFELEELLAEQPIRCFWPDARQFTATANGQRRIDQRFRAYPGERLFGLGRHQHVRLDQNSTVIDLEQWKAGGSIPLLVSSRGYGFLWNNSSAGRVELLGTGTRWVADSAWQIDYWLTVGSPSEIAAQYAGATGCPPAYRSWPAGFS